MTSRNITTLVQVAQRTGVVYYYSCSCGQIGPRRQDRREACIDQREHKEEHDRQQAAARRAT